MRQTYEFAMALAASKSQLGGSKRLILAGLLTGAAAFWFFARPH